MSAVVIDFASAVVQRSARVKRGAPRAQPFDLAHDFMFWHGESGACYVHTVFRLHDCPELPNANIVLARRSADGRAEALLIGRLEEAPSLNLAWIRHAATLIGADEVHVHLLGRDAGERSAIERDLADAHALASGGFAALH